MTYESVLEFLSIYGMPVIGAVVFLEYMNLPGFPSGVIMPSIGIWLAHSGQSPVLACLISIAAGIGGSLVLYSVGYLAKKAAGRIWGIRSEDEGDTGATEVKAKPESRRREKFIRWQRKLEKNARITIFTARLVPVIRTIISLPAGIAEMDIADFILYSGLGIAIWNTTLIFSGYIGGEAVFRYFG